MTEPTVLDLLRDGRAYIADGTRWLRGSMYGPDGKVCAVGSVRYAGGVWDQMSEFPSVRRVETIRAALEALYGACEELYPGRSVATVNDHVGLDAVLRIYDAAIARETAREQDWDAGLRALMPATYPDGSTDEKSEHLDVIADALTK